MSKSKYNERYDWGLYNGIKGIKYQYDDKQINVRNHVNYMLNRSLQMFEYEGLPDSLPAKELERLLQTNGYAGLTKVEGELYAFYGGLGGEPNVYGKPTLFTVSNPYLNYNGNLKIGEDIVLMKNDYMLMGLVPIYSKYGTFMNENEITMMLTTFNNRINNMISVADDNTAESAKEYLDNIEKGNLGYIFENKLFDSLKSNAVGEGSKTNISDLVEFQQYLKATMYNEIGLNANNNMKKERLITDEVQVNSESLYPLIDDMLSHRKEAIEEVNEMFDQNITVKLSSSWTDYRENQDEVNTLNEEGNEGISIDEAREISDSFLKGDYEASEEFEEQDEVNPVEETEEVILDLEYDSELPEQEVEDLPIQDTSEELPEQEVEELPEQDTVDIEDVELKEDVEDFEEDLEETLETDEPVEEEDKEDLVEDLEEILEEPEEEEEEDKEEVEVE